MEELEMAVEESVWQEEYQDKQLKVEQLYARTTEEVSMAPMQCVDAC